MLEPISVTSSECDIHSDLWIRAELAQAIVTLGRLLPQGMRVAIYHPDGEVRAAIETTYPDGETTRHWVNQAMN